MKKIISRCIALLLTAFMAVTVFVGIQETLRAEESVTGAKVSGIPTPTATPLRQPQAEKVPQLSATPLPTPTMTPAPTPTPTVTPTPTISVYDKIVDAEQQELSVSLPVKAALLVNTTKDEVIYSYKALEELYPASITKLVTALVALQNNSELEGLVTVSANAAKSIEGARMCKLKEGDQLYLKELYAAMLLHSGNDAAIALAEHISGSEEAFVALMNQTAKDLGLKSSNFCNSHGLPDDNHKTSAYDIYLIMEKLFAYEQFLGIIEMESVEVNILRDGEHQIKEFSSTNQFLVGEYKLPEGLTIIGGKTGTTNKAGYCLALSVKDTDGDCYIAEIYGTESYEQLYLTMIQLLELISEE